MSDNVKMYYGHSYMGLAEAFSIFAKYIDTPFDLVAEHDQIYAGDHHAIDSKDSERLSVLGWEYDTEVERWVHSA